ncbi:unnamed protein product [Chondrus crispus]|uniref:Uncharacterized protein n=1 Tax=Chondrus crispus TaxID=2769 RepID=S0F2W7_CHOCR|nr:unnamed protein product [Chondrus crispus]CDF77491.1 unnamed protein product [Chondrus crispus]|eukprot:XP_005712530.1 unnamed protein product [Chondrus crispus]
MRSTPLGFGFASLACGAISSSFRMTAGNLEQAEGRASQVRSETSTPPPLARKVENRPELVGGLPLWLTMGAMTQLKRWAEMLNFRPGLNLRARRVEKMENMIVSGISETPDLPVGAALRRIADAMEEELACLRLSLASAKAELSHAKAETTSLREQLGFFKLRNARAGKSKAAQAMSSTVSQLRLLLCKEQTRAAAAEKKLADLEERLQALETRNSMVFGDSVKLSAMYLSVVAVFVGYLMQQPYGPQILGRLFSANH